MLISKRLNTAFIFFLFISSFSSQSYAQAPKGSSSSNVKNDAFVIDLSKVPQDPCGDMWESLPEEIKKKKIQISKSVVDRFPKKYRPLFEDMAFSPKKLFISQCNSYKKELVESVTKPVADAKKKLQKAPETVWAHSLIELKLGFLSWIAWEIRAQVLPTLTPKERDKFILGNGTSTYAQEKAQEWLASPGMEIDAYVRAYLKQHHGTILAIYTSYADVTAGQSKDILTGLSKILADAQDKLDRFRGLQKDLNDAGKKDTPTAKLIKKHGFSGKWLDTFKEYEGSLRGLDKQYNIGTSTKIIVKSFQTDEPAAKIDAMFELLDTLAGTAASSNIPIVSLFGDIIQAYAQVGKQMLDAVNALGETLRKRSGYCIGEGAPTGRTGINRYEEAKQAVSQLPGELLCPLGHDKHPWKNIYEAVDAQGGRLFFWDGKKFIVGQKKGGGRPAVQESLKLISAARHLKYQTVEEKAKQVVLLAHVYNTPFPGGVLALMKESREVMSGIADLVRKLEPTIGRNDKNCNRQDLWNYLKTETGLDVNAFQNELYEWGLERMMATYAASYVAKNGGFGKKNTGRGNAYKKYKKIWDRSEELNVRKVTGQVRNERNPDVSCPECADAEIDVNIRNGLQIPGCETSQADERGKYDLYVITTKPTFNIDITATVKNISSDRLPLTEENFRRWDLIEEHLYVKLKKKEKKVQPSTGEKEKPEEKTGPDEPGLKTLPEPEPDTEPPEEEKDPEGEPETESSETEQDKKTDNTDSTSPSVKVGDTVTLPDVVGMGLMDAVAALEAVGLFALPEVGRSALNPEDVGRVEVAFPAKDGEVHAGDQIVLRVYDEAVDSGNVPNTIGMELAEAADVIKLAGLNPVFELGDETSDPKKDGTVASQAPAPGIEIEAGKDVTLIVYSLAVETRTVPNLDGLGLKAAQEKLKANDLFMTPFLEEVAQKKSDEGKVYKQYPEPGLDVMNGIAISVWVYGEVEAPVTEVKVEKPEQPHVTGGVETIYGTFNPDGTYESNGTPEKSSTDYIDLPIDPNMPVAPEQCPSLLGMSLGACMSDAEYEEAWRDYQRRLNEYISRR